MNITYLKENVVKELDNLPEEKQREVLDFTRFLAQIPITPKGCKGEDLLQFAGCINYEDVEIMKKTIEEDCERINWNEW